MKNTAEKNADIMLTGLDKYRLVCDDLVLAYQWSMY